MSIAYLRQFSAGPLIVGVAAVLCAAVMWLVPAIDPLAFVAAAAIVAFSVVSLWRPHYILAGSVLYTVFVIGRVDPGPPLISDWPLVLRWATYGAYPLFALLMLVRGWALGSLRVPLVVLGFLVLGPVALLSAVLNRTELVSLALALGVYLRYPILFAAVVLARIPHERLTRLVGLYEILMLLQIPIVVLQFALGARNDEVGGTLGGFGTGALGLMMAAVQQLFLARMLRQGFTWRFGLAYLGCFMPMVLGEAVGTLFFALVASGVQVIRSANPAWILRGALAAAAVALVFFASVALTGWTEELADWNILLTRGPLANVGLDGRDQLLVGSTDDLSVTRGDLLIGIPLFFLDRHPESLWFGFGPGALYNGRALGAQGVLCEQLALSGGPILCTSYQVSRTLLEVGIVGVAASVLAVVLLWLLAERVVKQSFDERWRTLAFGMQGMLIGYGVLAPFYADPWREDHVSILVWLVAAALALYLLDQARARREAS
jgi:hypothetical protein